ncbi:sensor domain-containing diguanylate cyclase [Thalassospira sp. MA62]|nr:sensor domain-containing diguanylate cyclase [Thalassospira sp. MA62]
MVKLLAHGWLTDDEAILASLDKWQRAVDLMTRMLGATAGYVIEFNEKKGFRAALTSQNDENPNRDLSQQPAPPTANVYCRRVVRDRAPLYVPDATDIPEWADNPALTENGYVSYYGVPLLWPNGALFGTLCIFDTNPTDYSSDLLTLVDCFRDLIEADLRLYEQFQIMRNISMTDPLTGLNNRAGFEMMAEQKIRIAKRYHHNIGIVFIDLDRMKHWNDDYGHAAGDAALRTVSMAISESIREVDICARVGGDEFAILGYVRTRGDLTTIITRIRNALATTKIHVPNPKTPIRETPKISCGATVFFEPVQKSLEDMLAAADLEMYRDKKRKRR